MVRFGLGFFSFFLLQPVCTQAQQYSVPEIIAKADSLLNIKIGALSADCRLSAGSYYSYMHKKHELYENLNGQGMTHDKFKEANVQYTLLLPYPQCQELDTIKATINITLDTALNMTAISGGDAIPYFVKAADSCRFISRDSALHIAAPYFSNTGISEPYAYLKPAETANSYNWVVRKIIWNEKSAVNGTTTKQDMILIDAVSGSVLGHRLVPYAVQ